MAPPKGPTRNQILMRMYRTDFIAFASLAYTIVYPGRTLQKNWHIDIIANALHGCLRGERNRLSIHAPPRSLKSFLASIAFPAFALGRDPTLSIMSIVANRELAGELCDKLGRLLSSDQYRSLFPHIHFERKREIIRLTHGGGFSSSAFFSSAIGRGADILIVDDPVAPGDAKNDSFNDKAAEWFTAEIVPRLNDKASSIAILVMQRLGKKDLCSAFFRGQDGKTLSFAAVSRSEERWCLPDGSIFVRPPRTVLNPKVETLEDLKNIYLSIGFNSFSCQYQQDIHGARYIGGPVFYPFDTTDWTPEKGYPDQRFLFSSEWYFRYECFELGEPPPYLTKNPLTPEQQQEYIIHAQAKLIAETMKDLEDN